MTAKNRFQTRNRKKNEWLSFIRIINKTMLNVIEIVSNDMILNREMMSVLRVSIVYVFKD